MCVNGKFSETIKQSRRGTLVYYVHAKKTRKGFSHLSVAWALVAIFVRSKTRPEMCTFL